jgi:hypothetical protein
MLPGAAGTENKKPPASAVFAIALAAHATLENLPFQANAD